MSAEAELRERFAGWGGPVSAVLDAIDPEDVITTPIYDRPPSVTWSAGRVTALGDATHGMTPTFGQGACLAIESAAVLATNLAAADAAALRNRTDLSDALAAFERKRIGRTRPVVRASRMFGRALQLDSPVATAARNRLLDWMPDRLHLISLGRIVGPGLSRK